MGKRLKRTLKIAVALLLLLSCAGGFLVSSWGHNWRKDRILRAYNKLPEEERRESALANDFLALAGFRERIGRNPDDAMAMYKEFCGFEFSGPSSDEFIQKLFMSDGKLKGLCSEDGATGWGPLHPRAPEAYYKYMVIYFRTHSGREFYREAANYYRLFFT